MGSFTYEDRDVFGIDGFVSVITPGVAAAESRSMSGGAGGLSFEGPLGVSEGSLLGGQGALEAEEAQRMSPEAVLAREKSESAYEGLSAEGAAMLDRKAFPQAVSKMVGGPPPLSAGANIVGYPAANIAQVSLPGNGHGVIESVAPIAVETSPGRRVPINLSLNDVGKAFEPVTPAIGVRIPKRLAEGVTLAGSAVSLTPVDAQGAPLVGSEGVVDGASVLYANTQTDTDTMIKPQTLGFDASTVLRSVDSPQQFFFELGCPRGQVWYRTVVRREFWKSVPVTSVMLCIQPPPTVL